MKLNFKGINFMIQKESFSKEWIANQRAKVSKAGPSIIEKLIHALSLVEQSS